MIGFNSPWYYLPRIIPTLNCHATCLGDYNIIHHFLICVGRERARAVTLRSGHCFYFSFFMCCPNHLGGSISNAPAHSVITRAYWFLLPRSQPRWYRLCWHTNCVRGPGGERLHNRDTEKRLSCARQRERRTCSAVRSTVCTSDVMTGGLVRQILV